MFLRCFVFLLFTLLWSCNSAQSEITEHNPSTTKSNVDQASRGMDEASAGNIIINGRVNGIPNGEYVMLYETEGRDYFLTDSAMVTDGRFLLNLESVETGIYKIGRASEPSKLDDVILNPKEDVILLEYQSPYFNTGLMTTNSRENNAYIAFKNEEKMHNQKVNAIRRSAKSSAEKQKAIYTAESDFKTIQLQLASKYPETFFANVVTHMQSPERFTEDRYWNDMDFKDKTLIHSGVYPSRIEDYMRIHASQAHTPSDPQLGFYNAVDLIANKIKSDGNDEVLEFVLYTLSEGFYSSGLEELSLYVIDNYFYGDRCGDSQISELFKQKAAGIKNLQIGSVTPNFFITDVNKKHLELNEIVKGNNYTLLLFWGSFCHKCQRDIPELKSIYNSYKSKGFEVIAISVDTETEAFQKGIESHSTTWPNACDELGWRGPIAISYRVTSTPVMFLLDNEQQLLLKPKSTSELNTYLRERL